MPTRTTVGSIKSLFEFFALVSYRYHQIRPRWGWWQALADVLDQKGYELRVKDGPLYLPLKDAEGFNRRPLPSKED